MVRILRLAVARNHPCMGVVELESGGRQGHHVGSMVRQMLGGGQMDGDVALVAQGDEQVVGWAAHRSPSSEVRQGSEGWERQRAVRSP